jgi:mannose-6-phosphate isomerase-like protein (cupin superfamily)
MDMTNKQISQFRAELLRDYPGAHIKVADDLGEMVADIDGHRAVAVVERSQPHFHSKTKEIYRIVRGTLHLACGGRGYLLAPGDSVTIEPGNIHFARAVGGPAWLEVLSEPDWTMEDYLLL